MAKQIKYVGVKEDGETAFVHETGITWYPGDSHAVPEKVAERMLRHPDVFAEDDEQKPADKKPVAAAVAAGTTVPPAATTTAVAKPVAAKKTAAKKAAKKV